MIEAVTIAVVALGALIYVVGPLRSGPRRDPAGRSYLVEDAAERKRAALGALVDIEDERSVGKLANADFDALRKEYELEALQALRELDELGARDSDDELEREIAELRARLQCRRCGALRDPGEGCPECGAQP